LVAFLTPLGVARLSRAGRVFMKNKICLFVDNLYRHYLLSI